MRIDEIDKDAEYVIPGDYLIGLKRLEQWLYNGSAFNDAHNHPGALRDKANWLNQGFFGHVEKLK